MMKKLLTLLTVILTVSMLTCALAKERPRTNTCGDYEYVLLKDRTAEILQYTGSKTSLSIPASLDGLPVSAIGDDAFSFCKTLTSVTIPDSVIHIGDSAFAFCKSLTSIVIPNSVTFIGENPFQCCSELAEIIVSPEHPTLETIEGVLFDKVEKELICYPQYFTTEHYAVPQGVRCIGANAFENCYLTSVTIPDSVIHIGDYAFGSCNFLSSVTVPVSVTSIGKNPFKYCNHLTEIIISAEHPVFETIDGMLLNKEEKALISYPPSFPPQHCTIPQGTRIIGDDAFYFCTTLDSITIPDSVTHIGAFSFCYCTTVAPIIIPNNVTHIGNSALFSCSVAVERGSYAEQYCKEFKLPYTYTVSN